MFNPHDIHYPQSKRQKLSGNYSALSNANVVKKNFLLDIDGDSECNLNKKYNTPSWIKYDLSKTKRHIDLSGGNWSVGISGMVLQYNSLNSWKNPLYSKTSLPSLAFIKIAIKYSNKPSEIMGVKFFENRLYSKSKVVSQLNTFLTEIWAKECRISLDGTNIVGEIFSLVIFSFYLNKLDNFIHILSLVNIQNDNVKKSWRLFLKTFNAFKKDQTNVIERIEIYISNELNSFLGDFQIPIEISNFKSDQNLIEYDRDLIAMDFRCGLIPYPAKFSSADMVVKYMTPDIKPSIVSIYTNIPINERANEKLINGGVYQLLAQIPIEIFKENSPRSIQYFPQKILYKTISQNYCLDLIEILLVDPETNKLINLNNNFLLNLDFKQTSDH